MNEIIEFIRCEIESLEDIKQKIRSSNRTVLKAKKRIEKTGFESNRLVVESKKGRNFYYMVDPDGKRIYLRKKEDSQIIRCMAQNDYNKKLIESIDERIKTLNYLVNAYPKGELIDTYDNLHPARKLVVQPIIESDEEYAKEWSEKSYLTNEYDLPSQTMDTVTKNGEIVRSKSEVILANMFYDNGVPYRYEPELVLNSGRRVFPDFICLNKRTRKEYIWEHFGMMDDLDYICRNIPKLREYEQSGYLFGINMIISYESSVVGFSNKVAQQYIESFLL